MRNSNYASFIPYIHAFLLGMLIYQVFLVSYEVTAEVYEKVSNKYYFLVPHFLIGNLIILLGYLSLNIYDGVLSPYVKSKRLDLFSLLLFGSYFVHVFKGFYIAEVLKYFDSLDEKQKLVLFVVPFLIFYVISYQVTGNLLNLFLMFIRKTFEGFQKKLGFAKSDCVFQGTKFLSDKEVENFDEDLLGLNEKVKSFSESVFDNGARETIVYGLDVPWGGGKTSFVNLCEKYMLERYRGEVVFFKFSPLSYDAESKLYQKFIEGLVSNINQHVYTPELNPLISKYYSLISPSNVNLFGLKIPIPKFEYTIEQIYSKLRQILSTFKFKTVVIIDDLDRLEFKEVIDLITSIKHAFSFPNISYVLCYDTCNFSDLDDSAKDKAKISEFLEKYINIKFGLYVEKNQLLKIFNKEREMLIKSKARFNIELFDVIKYGLESCLNSEYLEEYLKYVGNIRKIKRLVNTLVAVEVSRADFKHSDFNSVDLINLIIIYIYYPSIFSLIYHYEINQNNSYFSVVREGVTFKNNDNFDGFLKSDKLDKNAREILKIIFDVDCRERLGLEISNHNAACFNGDAFYPSAKRNLERYLRLITNMEAPDVYGQTTFYIRKAEESITTEISVIFYSDSFIHSESKQRTLWQRLINVEVNRVTGTKAIEWIEFLLRDLPRHSVIEMGDGSGLRNSMPTFLVFLLERFGWQDKSGKRRENKYTNIEGIAKKIFESFTKNDESILDILVSGENVLAFYDVLNFRLECCENRGGDVFNLTRAICKYKNPAGKDSGDLNEITADQMRFMSQTVFARFKERYVDKNMNLFDEIDNISLSDACGEYKELIVEGKKEEADKSLKRLKSSLKQYMTFQLGSDYVGSGIGCGFYDLHGNKDQKGIQRIMEKYLLNVCFNGKNKTDNYYHFFDYLLVNLPLGFNSENDLNPELLLDNFTKVISAEELRKFYIDNKEGIKGIDLGKKNKDIYTRNYSVNYKDDLKKVLKAFDAL